VERYLRKGKNAREQWGKKCEKQPCEHQGRRRRNGRCSGHGAGVPQQPVRNPTPEQMDITRGTATCGEPTLECGKSVRKGRWVAWRPRHPLCAAWVWGRGVESEGGKLSLSKGVGGKVLSCLSFCFSLLKSVLIGTKLNQFSPSWVWFACNRNWKMVSLSLSWSMTFLILFSLPIWWGVSEGLGGCLTVSQG